MSHDAIEVTIYPNDDRPLSWTVEAVNSDGDGGIDVTIFGGPGSDVRAREYALWKYGTRLGSEE